VITTAVPVPVTTGSEVGPPPHPGRHEGKPSTTWTPPVQADGSAAPQVEELNNPEY